jgi:hypothetical protein
MLEPSRGTPRLAMTSVVPGCVPAGIFKSTCDDDHDTAQLLVSPSS